MVSSIDALLREAGKALIRATNNLGPDCLFCGCDATPDGERHGSGCIVSRIRACLTSTPPPAPTPPDSGEAAARAEGGMNDATHGPTHLLAGETSHPYYCADQNFFSNEVHEEFETVSEFLDAFEEEDIDLNLVFRFDVCAEDNGAYSVDIAMMLQRKGVYKPIHCRSYNPETEGARLSAYLKKHFERNMDNWSPFCLPNHQSPAPTPLDSGEAAARAEGYEPRG